MKVREQCEKYGIPYTSFFVDKPTFSDLVSLRYATYKHGRFDSGVYEHLGEVVIPRLYEAHTFVCRQHGHSLSYALRLITAMGVNSEQESLDSLAGIMSSPLLAGIRDYSVYAVDGALIRASYLTLKHIKYEYLAHLYELGLLINDKRKLPFLVDLVFSCGGKPVFVEVKSTDDKLSVKQIKLLKTLLDNGYDCLVLHCGYYGYEEEKEKERQKRKRKAERKRR